MLRTIIACVIVALVAGATSATAARLITGDDIKNGSITGADIKNPAIDNEDIKKGAVIKKKLSKAVQDALDDKAPPDRRVPPDPRALLGGPLDPRALLGRRERPATPRTPRSASPPSS